MPPGDLIPPVGPLPRIDPAAPDAARGSDDAALFDAATEGVRLSAGRDVPMPRVANAFVTTDGEGASRTVLRLTARALAAAGAAPAQSPGELAERVRQLSAALVPQSAQTPMPVAQRALAVVEALSRGAQSGLDSMPYLEIPAPMPPSAPTEADAARQRPGLMLSTERDVLFLSVALGGAAAGEDLSASLVERGAASGGAGRGAEVTVGAQRVTVEREAERYDLTEAQVARVAALLSEAAKAQQAPRAEEEPHLPTALPSNAVFG